MAYIHIFLVKIVDQYKICFIKSVANYLLKLGTQEAEVHLS
jgi:hypothetical protein